MIVENEIRQVIDQQSATILQKENGLVRKLIPATASLASHALIISGVRRCGKSTFLRQILQQFSTADILFLNFDTPRLFDFSLSDFGRLDRIILEKGVRTLFLDELQLVEGWEMYVRQKLDEGFQVIITGSNASLLSKELGTRLTGRHITQELFPFSYTEFLEFKTLTANVDSLLLYLQTGGFPDYLKNNDEEQLATLFEDVILRDIVARYGIKDIKSLHRLAVYLLSNVGNRITATKLRQTLQVGATSTILSWFSHLEYSYLVAFLPMFSYSSKAQLINPRKVYAIDLGMVTVVTGLMTLDKGRKLENLIYIHLRKKYKELYFFDEKGECDFVAMKNGKVVALVQVCLELNADNLTRELNGLERAMQFFAIKKGIIVTLNNSDFIQQNGFEIEVVRAYEYLNN